MKPEIFWPSLKQAFGNQKVFWATSELAENPTITDRLLHYLISYYENPPVARNAIRIFRGLSGDLQLFSGWNEVRVASIRELDDALRTAGATGLTWDLAVTIKDFLHNMWVTLDTVDLNTVEENDIKNYLRQLRAIPHSWSVINEKGKKVTVEWPLRYSEDNFYKHFKRYRKFSDPVLPECAIDYLEYLLRLTDKAPFEYHANRIMARLGIIETNDPLSVKTSKFSNFTTSDAPVTKHKLLVQLGKTVCFEKHPRCNVCPASNLCAKKI